MSINITENKSFYTIIITTRRWWLTTETYYCKWLGGK